MEAEPRRKEVDSGAMLLGLPEQLVEAILAYRTQRQRSKALRFGVSSAWEGVKGRKGTGDVTVKANGETAEWVETLGEALYAQGRQLLVGAARRANAKNESDLTRRRALLLQVRTPAPYSHLDAIVRPPHTGPVAALNPNSTRTLL